MKITITKAIREVRLIIVYIQTSLLHIIKLSDVYLETKIGKDKTKFVSPYFFLSTLPVLKVQTFHI